MGWESDFLMCNYKQNKTDDGGNHEEKDDDDSQQVQQDETKIVQARLDSWKRTQGEVPDFVNRKTGYYRYGTRKCSKCKAVKDKSAFSQNEADKPSKKRKCNECMSATDTDETDTSPPEEQNKTTHDDADARKSPPLLMGKLFRVMRATYLAGDVEQRY